MKRLVLLLCTVLVLGGCSVQFLYNRLNWLIPWYLEDYIEFTSDQRALLEDRVQAQLDWHRLTQLPQYADWLDTLRADMRDGLTAAELQSHSEQLRQHLRRLLTRLAPDGATLLATATDAQLADLFAALEEKNREYQAEHVDLTERARREDYVADMHKQLERWLGEVTPVQAQAVAAWSQAVEPTGPETLAYRRHWQASLRQALTEQREPVVLVALLERPEQTQPTALQAKRARNQERLLKLLLTIDSSLTSGQRRYLDKQLADLASDFMTLASAN